MSEYILEMNNISVQRHSHKKILEIKKFALRQGELVGMIGPNGAGKSTLLQVINLLQSYQGEFQLFGQDARRGDKTLLRRRSAMVFQDTLLLNDTVFNNVALALGFRGESANRIKELVFKALADFHCDHLADRPALLLSGGEAKRVCIARALVTGPELLLLDEPFAALDVTTRDGMIEEIRKIAKDRNITVVLVSHDFSEVLHFAQRAVVLCNGSIVQDDKPENLMRRPANVQVARLVGLDNIIPCQLEIIHNNPFIRITKKLAFPYGATVEGEISACCIPGDALYLYDPTLGADREKWVKIEGVVERIIPGVANYRILVKVEEKIFSVRVPRNQVKEIRSTSQCIKFMFDPEEVHII